MMYGSKRKVQKLLGYVGMMLCLSIIFTACTSTTVHWITPVPPLDAPPTSGERAPAESDLETPEAVSAEMPSEPSPEATQDAVTDVSEEIEAETAGEIEAAAGEEAAEQLDSRAAGQPSPITHALARRETCSDCHAVDSRREPAPADHQGLTDNICVYCHLPEEGEAAIPPLPEKAATDFCLGCHGPHDELMARTTDYVTEAGLVGNPHMYIPHDKNSIASCGLCHEVHPLPVTAADEIKQADAGYCFAACHHEYDFTPCSECH